MRHDNERHAFLPIQFDQQLSQCGGGSVIERASGFIGEQELRTIDERADDGGALALAAGKLAGAMMQAFAEADAFEQTLGAGFHGFRSSRGDEALTRFSFRPALCGFDLSLLTSAATCQRRHEDVFQHGALWQEIVRLKNKADLAIADFGQLQVIQCREIFSIEQHFAARGAVQRADNLQQRTLARAGRADDGQRFATCDFQRDVGKYRHARRRTGGDVMLGDLFQCEQICGRRHGVSLAAKRLAKQEKTAATVQSGSNSHDGRVFNFWNGRGNFLPRRRRGILISPKNRGFSGTFIPQGKAGTALAWRSSLRYGLGESPPWNQQIKNMTKQKIKMLTLAVLLGSLTATPLRAAEATTDYKPFTAGVEVGTLGPGVSFGWRFSELLGVHAGVNYFSLSKDNQVISGINYNTSDLRMFSAPIGLDIYPWHDKPFRLTVGALINGNKFDATAYQQAPGALSVMLGNSGGIDSAAIGDLNMKVEQNTIAPYVSIGGSWFLDKKQRWSLGGEIGVAYAGSPEVTLTRSNGPDVIDSQVAIEKQQLEDDFNKYTVYPIVKVTLSFSF